MRVLRPVLGMPIDAIDVEAAASTIVAWAKLRESRVVAICNAHSLVTARQDSEFNQALMCADMATPDGAPVAATLRLKGVRSQLRVTGPDVMLESCRQLRDEGISVFLFGSTTETLMALEAKLFELFPGIQVVGTFSPPFRALSQAEMDDIWRRINQSGAGVVWVGLGCPKQEKWMHLSKGHVRAVMVGVGAAFDYHIGSLQRAPQWMQSAGFEWLYRLAQEPRRLWRRYLITNSLFIWYSIRDAIRLG